MPKPAPAEENDLPAEEFDHQAAHAILGKFLSRDAESVLGMFDEIEDPVVAAAVSLRVAMELDPSQIAEFLAMLEDESGEEDEDEDGAGDPPESGGSPV